MHLARVRVGVRVGVRVRVRVGVRLRVGVGVRVGAEEDARRVQRPRGHGALRELGRAEGVLQLELRDKREAAVYLDHVVGEEVGARRAQLLGEADGDEAVVRVGPLVRVRVGVRVWG